MSDTTERIIASLRVHHDLLADLVGVLDAGGLAGRSGASEWSIADVLSHLGSGAEITLVPISAAITGAAVSEQHNEAVWARWDAAAPADQASAFVDHDARLVEALESLSAEQRASLRVDLGFVPEPVALEVALGLRLNEVAQHSWDVQAGLDPAATLDEEAAELLVGQYAGGLGFMLGFIGKADAVDEPAVVEAFGHGLVIEETVLLIDEPPVAPTGAFVGQREAFVRLLGGRLAPSYTPEGVHVSGNVTLDDLRRVFPGF